MHKANNVMGAVLARLGGDTMVRLNAVESFRGGIATQFNTITTTATALAFSQWTQPIVQDEVL